MTKKHPQSKYSLRRLLPPKSLSIPITAIINQSQMDTVIGKRVTVVIPELDMRISYQIHGITGFGDITYANLIEPRVIYWGMA